MKDVSLVMSIVALVKCNSYDYPLVKQAVERGLNLLGGAEQFAKPGEKILLKPNFLISDNREHTTNTHFAVFKAVAEAFKKTGARISYGDSPAFGSAAAVAKRCGIYSVAEELGIELQEFNEGKDVFFKEGVQNRKFTIAKAVLEADGIISLPKIKTHQLTILTGCIKNQLGCVPGILKGELHVKLPDPLKFAQMLVDLNNIIKPRLYVMDGIVAMEGNGPSGGTSKPMKVLLFSTDPVALDATVCRMIKVEPENIPTIRFGREQGMGVSAEDQITIVGDNIADVIIDDFDININAQWGGTGFKKKLSDGLIKLLGGLLISKPYILADKCVKCGICVKQCPVLSKAVNWRNEDKTKPPVYNYKLCIKCYCCQEVCPEGAIKLKKPFLRWLFSRKRAK